MTVLTAGVVAANAQRNAEDEIVDDIARRRGRRGGRDAEASPLRVVRFRRDQTMGMRLSLIHISEPTRPY